MHTGIGTVLAAAGICIAGIALPPAADTLQPSANPIDSMAPANAPPAASRAPIVAADSAAIVARSAPARRRTDTVSRRDSLLHSVLRSIAQEGAAAQPAATVRRDAAVRGGGRTVAGRAAAAFGRFIIYKWKIIGVVLACLLIAALAAALARTRRKKDEKRFMTTTRLSLMDGEVQRACLFIEKHFHDPSLSPASVCTGIVTGEPFLEALFAHELGMGIAAYIEQVRIHRAKQVATWNPAADAQFVASQAGYTQAAAFEKSFERIAGVDFESFRREKSAAAR